MNKEELTPELKQKTLDELNSAEEVPKEDSGLRTRVTSVAKEEERTGKKIEVPTAEKLVANASIAILQTRKGLHQQFAKMSKKAMLRAVVAIFSLPENDLPVQLKTDEEKVAYALAQRHMMARFTVMQKAVLDEHRERKEKLEKEMVEAKATKDELLNNNKETTNE